MVKETLILVKINFGKAYAFILVNEMQNIVFRPPSQEEAIKWCEKNDYHLLTNDGISLC